MASVLDVAKYILEKTDGDITTWKLEKLVYYSQAWHLVWEDKPLFEEKIEAWSAGPVVPELYKKHKGLYAVSNKNFVHGNSNNLTHDEKESINVVLADYGKLTGYQLSEISHKEKPWIKARGDCQAGESCKNEITLASIGEYYSSLK